MREDIWRKIEERRERVGKERERREIERKERKRRKEMAKRRERRKNVIWRGIEGGQRGGVEKGDGGNYDGEVREKARDL